LSERLRWLAPLESLRQVLKRIDRELVEMTEALNGESAGAVSVRSAEQ